MLSVRIWFWWKLDDWFYALGDACARRANALERIELDRITGERRS